MILASRSFSRSRGSSPLTVACVPTGINTGVSISPCAVCKIPARAPVCGQVAWISKRSTGIYCKIDCVWLLFFLLTALAWAQPAGAPKPVFPDDTQDPKDAGGAKLLEAVCPGHVVEGKDVECRIVCPEFTAFKGEEYGWRLKRITRGHFLSSISDDAVLSMGGCEPHSFNFGGTILLSKRSGKWAMH